MSIFAHDDLLTINHLFQVHCALTAVGLLLFAVTALAFASKGGGEKKKHHELENSFTPINAASSFTLKKSPLYSGSSVLFVPRLITDFIECNDHLSAGKYDFYSSLPVQSEYRPRFK